VKIGVLTLVATQAMNLALIVPLKHAGLALAIGLGACLNAALLYRYLRKYEIFRPQPGWALFAMKIVAAVTVMAGSLSIAMGGPEWWLAAPWQVKLPALVALVAAGAGVYALCLFVLGFRVRQFSRGAAP
jgi:putative peptidoglycan lipid II flippase